MALYPPIVASSMPPFANTRTAKVYFSFSDYNQKSDIASVQVSVRRQDSNANIIVNGNEIEIYEFDSDENGYFIAIDSDDSTKIKHPFSKDTLYKVQLRFSAVSPTSSDMIDGVVKAEWFSNNLEKFSEWSTVCLIKRIEQPSLSITEFDKNSNVSNLFNTFGFNTDSTFKYYHTLADFNIIYKQVYYSQTREKEIRCSQPLEKWRLRLYNADKTELLADSGEHLNSAYNYNVIKDYYDTNSVVHCQLPYKFESSEVGYNLVVDIETRNGYTKNRSYYFVTELESHNGLNATLLAAANEEEGYIKLEGNIAEAYNQNLVIRRASSKDNFLIWEDIKYFIGSGNTNETFTYYDFTVESGTFYKYLIQKVDIKGRRGTPVYVSYKNDKGIFASPGIMGEWNHAFLLQAVKEGKGNLSDVRQLKLKFDFQISNYKYNVSESKTDTLGSKYPFIKRNGDVYYRSFGCSGTISDFMDDSNLFITDNALYDNKESLYKTFKGEIGNYTNQYDYIKERKFREKVQEFLYNTKPKLYKSTQEGNILIKLMEVSLTPKTELGRLIYTFSATAYEIDSADINGLKQYDFISPGNYETEISKKLYKLGTLTCYKNENSYKNIGTALRDKLDLSYFPAKQDVIGAGSIRTAANSIANKINYNESFNNKIITSFKVKWLRVAVESDPYIIYKNAPYSDNNSSISLSNNNLILFKQFPSETDYSLGTLAAITVEGQNKASTVMIAPPNNIYEVTDIPIKSFVFLKNTSATIDYEIEYIEEVDEKSLPSQTRDRRVNGQIYGTYQNFEVSKLIKEKYYFNYQNEKEKFEQYVIGIRSFSLDTEPNTVIEVTTKNNSNINAPVEFIVNQTGEFSLDFSASQDVYINSIKIKGKLNGDTFEPVDAYVFYYVTVRGDYYN